MYDMYVSGGTDPTAILAVANAFSSQCQAVASTQQDDSFALGAIADSSGGLGFENTVLGGSAAYAYAADVSSTPGWTLVGEAGISENSDVFQYNLPSPEGTFAAFVQGVGSLSRTLELEVGVEYELQWQEARRSCNPSVCFAGQVRNCVCATTGRPYVGS